MKKYLLTAMLFIAIVCLPYLISAGERPKDHTWGDDQVVLKHQDGDQPLKGDTPKGDDFGWNDPDNPDELLQGPPTAGPERNLIHTLTRGHWYLWLF